jgi:maltose alpha-D-glucosyltransferase/alpha-amylase
MKRKGHERRVLPLTDDPRWYKDAVIYELRVRSFMDSNGDGVGDFPGLTEKLGYLQDLGVTALWLLPFYPSPGRDDGYDIADYTDVHPDMGTMDDFCTFLAEAHRRGMRVITELVVNHTSDQHPWFQRARRAPVGSPERDFYVWSDTADRWKEARIIFKDFEASNWSWDPVAKQYYWHRFFNHQPDLNFDNPQVQDAVLKVCDFWMELGVDGMRLDAVPYLFEREGTNCENLPEGHIFLKRLRKHIDERFKNRMLLAEANQWPEDAALYFGDGDECHMNFHFPIMPRIFMSIHMEDRFPISDILAQTPQVHESCQWALFLRNHDELTLEMVTDEERDYMYRAYAHDPTARINLGIRRRLAPLLGNNRRNIELMNGLLFSLPGTPVVYYGDEIGMGDNIYLGDRNGVRTPMQWSGDRNAGFSRANPQKLILPVNIDPEYHFESINVEAQQNNPNSLLWWTKRLIALRKRFQAFGRGGIEFLQPDNPRVLAFLRQFDGETLLVVANLSRLVQYVELDLAKLKGMVPVELFGSSRFPAIGELPYLLTLGGHAFYWFKLEKAEGAEAFARAEAHQPQTLELAGEAERIFDEEGRALIEEALPAFLESRHWFSGHGRAIRGVSVLETFALPGGPRLCTARVEYTEGDGETYALPLQLHTGEAAHAVRARSPQSILLNVKAPNAAEPHAALIDVLGDAPSSAVLLQAFTAGQRVPGQAGELVARVRTPVTLNPEAPLMPRYTRASHQNAAMVYGDRYVLKLYRRLAEGTTPEAEVGAFLAGRGAEVATAPLLGSLSVHTRRGEPVTVALLQAFVPHEANGWPFFIEELRRYFERVITRGREEPSVDLRPGPTFSIVGQKPPLPVSELVGVGLDSARQLGVRTAELHRALAASSDDPAFAPEPYSALDQRSVYQTMRNLTGSVLRALRSGHATMDAGSARAAEAVLQREGKLYQRFEPLLAAKLTSLRTRTHGELHLGQVLHTGKDFVIVDFDGDSRRPLTERRRKRSPLRDVSSMLGSIARAVSTVLGDESAIREADRVVARPWGELWARWVWATYLGAYLEASSGAPYLPRESTEQRVLLETYLLESALIETARELSRPSNKLEVALRVLAGLLDHPGF